jgi:hypothetical protein
MFRWCGWSRRRILRRDVLAPDRVAAFPSTTIRSSERKYKALFSSQEPARVIYCARLCPVQSLAGCFRYSSRFVFGRAGQRRHLSAHRKLPKLNSARVFPCNADSCWTNRRKQERRRPLKMHAHSAPAPAGHAALLAASSLPIPPSTATTTAGVAVARSTYASQLTGTSTAALGFSFTQGILLGQASM